MWSLGLCGSWLACDSITAVLLALRGDPIAGKPGSHKSQRSHKLVRCKAYRI